MEEDNGGDWNGADAVAERIPWRWVGDQRTGREFSLSLIREQTYEKVEGEDNAADSVHNFETWQISQNLTQF